MIPKPNLIGNWQKRRPVSFVGKLALCAILVACGHLARAQVPVNQLHFAFTDPPGTTNTPSDNALDPGALILTLGMSKPLTTTTSGPGDLHGAIGSGVA